MAVAFSLTQVPRSARTSHFPLLIWAVPALGGYAVVGGLITLAGWALDVQRLTDWRNDGISMFPNPAMCGVLSGIGILLSIRAAAVRKTPQMLLGCLVLAIGAATLLEHVAGIDLGIDRLLFDRPWGQTAAAAPMRMGLPASVSFLMIGTALIGLSREAGGISSALGVSAAAIAMLSLIGYAYGVEEMYANPYLTGIALQTASMLLALGLGIVASSPGREPMRTLVERSAAGMLARWALPIIIALSLLLGWLPVFLRGQGLADPDVVNALRTLVEIGFLVALLWSAVAMIRAREQALHASEARDVTERKQAEEARALLAAIVEASEDAIVSKTLDGVITSWNLGAERIFGYGAEEIIGKRIEVLLPEDRVGEEREILERVRRGERINNYETVRRAKSGRLFDIAVTISPVKDAHGHIIGASKIARDITDRKRNERERDENNRRKDEFIAILAHELRNPLAPVRSSVRYLREKMPADPGLRRSAEIIERQVAQMARLIDDLLDVSRMSLGTLELRRERVDLSEVIDTALDACHGELHSKGHRLQTAIPERTIELEADAERLLQVLCNIIGNAAKYTPAGGQIELSANVIAADTLEVSVKDNGIGIPPEKLAQIFDLFTRVDRSLERQGGLGIGLTLARQLVELHGGTIEARSAGLGKGSEILMRLPIVVPHAPDRRALPESANTCVPLRILVADDNEDAAESLKLLLQLGGHDVSAVYDGEAAIARAKEFLPQVVFLDIGMPKLNGYEAAKRLRQDTWGRQAYLVALTGWGNEADKRLAGEAGFDEHMVKPIPPEDINRLLRNVAKLN